MTNDVINSNTDTKDILIGNYGTKTLSAKTNEIIQCINKQAAVVVSDLSVKISEKSLRKASIIILEMNKVDQRQTLKLIEDQHHSSVWYHMTKIICILTHRPTINDRFTVLNVFTSSGFFNVAVVYKTVNNDVRYEILGSMAGNVAIIIHSQDSNSIFPDKLQNMHGYHYRVAIFQQIPHIDLRDKTRHPRIMHFLQAVGKAQNSNVGLILLQNFTHLGTYWQNRAMDLTLNTGVEIDSQEPKLLTYETQGYCIMAPIPPKSSFSDLILYKPFDGVTWVFLALSVAGSVAVWRLYKGRGSLDSHWRIAAGIFTMFINQSANFSLQKRFVLAVLLNIICMSMLLLSKLYEGVITSSMIESVHDNRMKSLDNVLASDYEILIDKRFASKIKNAESFQAIKSRIKVETQLTMDQYKAEIKKQHFVLIRTCENAHHDMDLEVNYGQRMSKYYYVLPMEFSEHYVQLEASFLNPYLERLQLYMDWSFQAGLHHIWHVYSTKSTLGSQRTEEERQLLKLKNFYQIFIFLAVGLGFAVFVLLVEIFVHDCLHYARLRNVQKQLKRLLCRSFRDKNNSKLKVRRIFVKN